MNHDGRKDPTVEQDDCSFCRRTVARHTLAPIGMSELNAQACLKCVREMNEEARDELRRSSP